MAGNTIPEVPLAPIPPTPQGMTLALPPGTTLGDMVVQDVDSSCCFGFGQLFTGSNGCRCCSLCGLLGTTTLVVSEVKTYLAQSCLCWMVYCGGILHDDDQSRWCWCSPAVLCCGPSCVCGDEWGCGLTSPLCLPSCFLGTQERSCGICCFKTPSTATTTVAFQ